MARARTGRGGAGPGQRSGAASAERLLGSAVPVAGSDELQRKRLMRALAAVAAESGGRPTVAQVIARAGISRRTFYERFSDVEECAIAAFDDGVRRATAFALGKGLPENWPSRVRAVLVALLDFFDEEPDFAQLCLVASLRGGDRLLERRASVLGLLVGWVDLGRAHAARGREVPTLSAEAAVAAVAGILEDRLRRSPGCRLRGLAGELTEIVLLPYLGPAGARRERERAGAADARRPAGGRALPKPAASPVRLTYRTVRVLMAVGEQPGASNRQIATAAGVADQGQMSKLLARLSDHGLVRNDGSGLENAWRLTDAGAEIEHSMRRVRL